MGANVFLAPTPILQFLNNAGQPNAGGSVLTQVGGVNYPTYQDSGGNTPLPNPIPLNSRGEISNTSGISCQLFLAAGVTYVFTQYDLNNNQINQATWMGSSAIQASDYALGFLNRVVDSIAALRAISHSIFTRAFVTGYYGAHDGGGGAYQYDASDGTSTDNGGTIIVANDGARWKLQVTGALSIKQFGAPCNGTADDGPYITNHLTWLSANGGGTAMISDGAVVTLNSNVNVPDNCSIAGSKQMEVDENNVPEVLQWTRIMLNTANTISLNNASTLRNLVILNKNFSATVTSAQQGGYFVGTAVTIVNNTSGHYVEGCVILGFQYGVASPTTATSIKRTHVRQCIMDCLNCVYLLNSYDDASIVEVRGRPFCSFNAASETGSAQLKRQGVFIDLEGVSAYVHLSRCFSFGWQTGYKAATNGNGGVTWMDCGADHPGQNGVSDGSIGYDIENSTYECIVIAPKVSGKDIGFKCATLDPNGKITVLGGLIYESITQGVTNVDGTLLLTGCLLRNAGSQGTPVGTGIYPQNTSTKTQIVNCNIAGFNTGINNQSSGVIELDALTTFDRCTTQIVNPYLPGVVTGNPLAIDGNGSVFHVNGTGTITSISHPDRYSGRPLILKTDGVVTFNNGGNMKLPSGGVTTTADSTLTFVSDGTTFYLVASSINT